MLADIEYLKQIVVEAGKAALLRVGTVDSEYKADQSLVTAVDRETEQFLEKKLKEAYPDYAFFGEEYGWRGDHGKPLWACDPIDGTTNFVWGIPQWCVSVGLIHEGVSQMGAVYLPVLDELYWGVRGQGSFCNGIRLSTVDRDSLHVEDTICVTSNAAKSLNIEAINGRIRCFGSIATELCYTARGNITATLGLKEGIVDIAAALCICSEAGCVFEYLDGEPVNVVELLDTTRTYKHFVYGPPRLVKHLQTILHVTA